MSIRVTWQASTDPNVASYDIQHSVSISGPWTLLVNVPHNLSGPNYDQANTEFFYVDAAGAAAAYYRITAIDTQGQRSAPSTPFRAATEAAFGYSAAQIAEVVIPVGNVDALLALGYTHIEVWKSEDRGNMYREITGIAAPPVLVSLVPRTLFYLKNASLVFNIDGTIWPVIEFGVQEYWSALQVADKINSVISGVAAVNSDGAVAVSGARSGRASFLQLTKASLASSLGFSMDRVVGVDGRLQLLAGQPIYFYYDSSPLRGSSYRWRWSANGSGPYSDFSKTTRDTNARLGVEPGKLSIATALFVNVDGTTGDAQVLVAPYASQLLDGALVSALKPLVYTTDETGFLQIPLVRGARVKIALEGTSIVRDITVPDLPSFDLFRVLNGAPDAFTVQTVPPLLTRRSL